MIRKCVVRLSHVFIPVVVIASLVTSILSFSPQLVSAAPAAPTLVSPANGASVPGTSVNFEWGSVTGAVSYRIIVSTSTNILDTTKYKCNVALTETFYDGTGYPANGTKYIWWVWAYAADGSQSAWVEVSANGRWFSNTSGNATITITPPSAIAFGMLAYSATEPMDEASVTSGKVTVVPGTSGTISWTVTAQASTGNTPGKMSSGTTDLTYWLLIGKDLAGPWYNANGSTDAGTVKGTPYDAGPLTYTDTTSPGTIGFCALQWMETTDTKVGTYSATITFTASCLP
jgi:hypothetical protein